MHLLWITVISDFRLVSDSLLALARGDAVLGACWTTQCAPGHIAPMCSASSADGAGWTLLQVLLMSFKMRSGIWDFVQKNMQLIMMCNFFFQTYCEFRLILRNELLSWMAKIVIIGFLTPFTWAQRSWVVLGNSCIKTLRNACWHSGRLVTSFSFPSTCVDVNVIN